MAVVSKICAFMYFDYVEYLRDLLNALQQEKGCSIRSVQAFLGVKGSGFFTRILDRSRPLSIENAKKIASATAMSAEEASYFVEMVKFGNEKNVDTREILLKKLLQVRSSKQEFALSDSTLQFFGKWYIPVIRDLLPLLQEKSTAPDLAQKIGNDNPRPQRKPGAKRNRLPCGKQVRENFGRRIFLHDRSYHFDTAACKEYRSSQVSLEKSGN